MQNASILKFTGKGISAADAEFLTDFFSVSLVKSRLFKVLDRNNIEMILREQSFQAAGCTDTACAVEIGKLLNTDIIFTGSVHKPGEKYFVTINMVSVETGEIIISERSGGFSISKSPVEIEKLVKKISENPALNVKTVKKKTQNTPAKKPSAVPATKPQQKKTGSEKTNTAAQGRGIKQNTESKQTQMPNVRKPDTTNTAEEPALPFLQAYGYSGYITGGLKYLHSGRFNNFIPWLDTFILDNRTRGVSMAARLNYTYETLYDRTFDIFSFDDFYVRLDYNDFKKNQRGFLRLGDEIKAYSPVTVWALKIRGLNTGIRLFEEYNGFVNRILLEGFWGFSRQKIPGYLAGPGEDFSLNRSGRFEQQAGGGSLSFNLGRFFRFEQMISLFRDRPGSLAENENYLTRPEGSEIFSSKLAMEQPGTHAYFNYAGSRFYNIGSSDYNYGNAFYLDGESYLTGNMRISTRSWFLDKNYYTCAVSDFVNDIMNILISISWAQRNLYLLADLGVKRNNTDFIPAAEILTTARYSGKLGILYYFNDKWNFSSGFSLERAESLLQVNNNLNDLWRFKINQDITGVFFLQDSFNNIKTVFSAGLDYKNDQSLIAGERSKSETILDYGLRCTAEYAGFKNSGQILSTQIWNGARLNTALSTVHRFSCWLIPQRYDNYFEYSLRGNFPRSSSALYQSFVYGQEFFFRYFSGLSFSIGYDLAVEKNRRRGDTRAALDYRYAF